MPSRHPDHHHKERVVYDDEPPYYDDAYDRPRPSRRVSRSAHRYDDADVGGHRRRRYDSPSPVRPSRARSEGHHPSRPTGRGRYDSYDGYSEYSDSEDDRHRRRGHGHSSRRRDSKVSGSSRPRSGLQRRGSDKAAMLQAAASAAVVAGATEAWRMRNEKTSWSRKGTKMATAAAGAAAFAAFNNNGSGSGSRDHGSSKKDALQATLGGLLVNRLANGGRK
ncbi:hypothetical protein EsH8_VI_000854 [Colletotrichum jinshuiense]